MENINYAINEILAKLKKKQSVNMELLKMQHLSKTEKEYAGRENSLISDTIFDLQMIKAMLPASPQIKHGLLCPCVDCGLKRPA